MAGTERSILIKFIGESKSLEAAAGKADAATAGFGVNLNKLASSAAYGMLTRKAIEFGKESVKAAIEDGAAQKQLALALRQATDATDEQVAAVERSISKLQDQTGVLDDELRPAFATLVRATKDQAASTDLLSIAADVAAGKGKDLGSVADALAKAYQGNTKGLRDLGVELKNADGSAKSFQQISEELVGLYGGSAKAAFDADPAKQLQVQLENLKETVGNALLPVVQTLAGAAQDLLGWFNGLDAGTQRIVVTIGLLGGGSMAAVKSVSSLVQAFSNLKISAGGAAIGLGALGAVIAVAAVAYQQNAEYKAKLKQETEEFAAALRAEAAGQKDATLALIASKLATANLTEVSNKLGISIQDMADFVQGKAAPSMDKLVKQFPGLTKGGVDANGALVVLHKQFGVNADDMLAFGTTMGLLRTEYEAATISIGRQDAASKELGVSTDGVAGSATDAAAAERDLASAAAESERAIRDLTDAKLAAIDANFAVHSAEDRLTESMAALATAADDPKTGVNELRQAQDEATQAAVALAVAQRDNQAAMLEAAGAPMTAAASNQALIDSLYNIATSLDNNSPVKAALIGYIGLLQSTPGSVNTTVTADTSDAAERIGFVRDAANELDGTETTTDSKAKTETAQKAIDDLTLAVDNVPKSITISVAINGLGSSLSDLDRLIAKLRAVRDAANEADRAVARVAG